LFRCHVGVPSQKTQAKSIDSVFYFPEGNIKKMWPKPIDENLLTHFSHMESVYALLDDFRSGSIVYAINNDSRFFGSSNEKTTFDVYESRRNFPLLGRAEKYFSRNCIIFAFDICDTASYNHCLKVGIYDVLETYTGYFSNTYSTPRTIIFVGFEDQEGEKKTPNKRKEPIKQKVQKVQQVSQEDIDKLVSEAIEKLQIPRKKKIGKKLIVSGFILKRNKEEKVSQTKQLFQLLDHNIQLSLQLPPSEGLMEQSNYLFIENWEENFKVYLFLYLTSLCEGHPESYFACLPSDVINLTIRFTISGSQVCKVFAV
jgi:hypothetical protein